MNRPTVAQTYGQGALVQRHTFEALLRETTGVTPVVITDIGCGNGYFTHRLADCFPTATIEGVDANEALIAHAKLHYAHPRITYQVGDAMTYFFSESDLILANASLHWMTPLEGCLDRLSQRLSKHGMVLASIFGPRTYWELAETIAQVMGRPIVLASTHFLGPQEVLDMGSRVFGHARVWQVHYRQWFPSVMGLLQNIKQTGTRGNGIPGVIWTQGLIEEVDRVYRRRFRSIWATYQVTMIQCQL